MPLVGAAAGRQTIVMASDFLSANSTTYSAS